MLWQRSKPSVNSSMCSTVVVSWVFVWVSQNILWTTTIMMWKCFVPWWKSSCHSLVMCLSVWCWTTIAKFVNCCSNRCSHWYTLSCLYLHQPKAALPSTPHGWWVQNHWEHIWKHWLDHGGWRRLILVRKWPKPPSSPLKQVHILLYRFWLLL